MRRELIHGEITEQELGAAIEVPRRLGPGLLESAYEASPCHELGLRGLSFKRQAQRPVEPKGCKINVSVMKEGSVRRILCPA